MNSETSSPNELAFAELDRGITKHYQAKTMPTMANWAGATRNRPIVQQVVDATLEFINTNSLLPGGQQAKHDLEVIGGVESFNSGISLTSHLGVDRIVNFVESCGIPPAHQEQAVRAVTILLGKAAGAKNPVVAMSSHFTKSRDGASSQTVNQNMATTYSASLQNLISGSVMPSVEAFGADIDKVLPDIRIAIAVTMLQFHRSLLDRILPRRTYPSPYVKYVVPYAEVYDLMKSMAPKGDVRNEGDHVIPFINLYADPKPVSTALQTIVPLLVNDSPIPTKKCLASDGVMLFDRPVNLFDMSVIPNQVGQTHHNWTDLISEMVILDSVQVSLTSGGNTEVIQIPLSALQRSKLQMAPNTVSSGVRMTDVSYSVKLTNRQKTITGATTTIFAGCDAVDCIKLDLRVAAQIDLKTGVADALGSVKLSAYNANGATVKAGVTTLMNGLTGGLHGWTLDARFSEENLRKSNLAIRTNVRTMDYEINAGRNILVDYAMNQNLPDFVMANVTEANALGMDHRGIDIIIRTLLDVYDRTRVENADQNFQKRLEKIGFNYVGGQLVRPTVFLGNIDLADVESIRAGDYYGDVRMHVERILLVLLSLMHQKSFYKTQLAPGEKATYKLFTSSIILENLFSIPHYHNHIQNEQTVEGDTTEYVRILPNGVRLECVSCTYEYMVDKIVIIPSRPNHPDDVLNFAHNLDYGTFIAHYNAQDATAVNKRVFANSRSMVLPTNPLGIYLDVKNIDKLTEMYQAPLGGINATVLASPSKILAEA